MFRTRIISAILYKDFYKIIKNKTALFAVLTPIILSLFFSIIFSQKDILLPKVTYVAENNSNFISYIKKTNAFKLEKESSWNKACDSVKNGKYAAALFVPKNFSSGSSMILFIDNSLARQSFVVSTATKEVLRGYFNSNLPIDLKIETVNPKTIKPRQGMITIWILFTLLGGIMITAALYLEEKETKTLSAILVTPANLREILISKVIIGFILVLIGSGIILILNKGLIGNLFSLIIILILGALNFSIMGILLGVLSPSSSTANAISSLLYLVLFMPVILSESSKAMLYISKGLPSYYILEGINKAMFTNASFLNLWKYWLFLLFSAIILFFINKLAFNSYKP